MNSVWSENSLFVTSASNFVQKLCNALAVIIKQFLTLIWLSCEVKGHVPINAIPRSSSYESGFVSRIIRLLNFIIRQGEYETCTIMTLGHVSTHNQFSMPRVAPSALGRSLDSSCAQLFNDTCSRSDAFLISHL